MGGIKKKRAIKNKDDLPSWFHIDNYNALRNFTYWQWVDVISVRYKLNESYKWFGQNAIKDFRITPEQVLEGEISEALYPLRSSSQPITLTAPSVQSLSFKDAINLTYNLDPVANNPIMMKAIGLLEDKATEEIEEHQHEISEEPYDILLQKADWLSNADAHVVIDLYASDKQILEDTKKWLIEFRKISNIKAASDAHFFHDVHKRWWTWSIVPYLDLFLWSNYENVEISNALMARTIFANISTAEKQAIDTLRDSTIPKAQELLTLTGWRSLLNRS